MIDPSALAECFQGSGAYPGYGLTLWLNRAETDRDEREGLYGASLTQTFYPNGLRDLLVAAGSDNQRMYVIPSLDLVVVRFGAFDRRWRDQTFLALLVEGVISARPTGPGAHPPG